MPRVPSPSHRAIALALLALGASACGQAPEPPAASARIRLEECPGVLHAPSPPAAETLLAEDFAAPPPGWSVITDAARVLDVDPEALAQGAGSEDGRTFLTLSGRRGALWKALPVAGGDCFLFEGELRARGLARDVEPYFGGTFWLGELAASGSLGDLFGKTSAVDRRHALESAAGSEGWQARRAFFRAGADTRTLLVGCVFDMNPRGADGALHESRGAAVDFDRLRVARIPARELWELQAAQAVAYAHRGDELPPRDDWRARRAIGAMFAAEQRPAILCLPGERLELELDVPRDGPVLECGLAPFAPDLLPSAEPSVFQVELEGRALLDESLRFPAAQAEIGWHDVTVDLAPCAGRRVKLALSVAGPRPGVFGAPVVRARGAPPGGWNVLLVSIDTLRADRVGAYGAKSGATPRLDALAKEACVFEDVTASAPYTLPAHASLFSGQFPSVHGVEDQGRLLSPRRSPVLARILAARGYRTQAFASAAFLHPEFGFDTGFDGFAIADPLRHPGSDYFREFRSAHPEQAFPGVEREPGVERVKRWIEAHAREPFFLFVHTYEVHDYDPPPGTVDCAARGCTSKLTDESSLLLSRRRRPEPFPGTPEDRAHVGHLYDAALRHVDGELGELLDELARAGVAGRTLVVVTSDHGEEQFERGFLQHGKSLFNEVLRIPLVVRVPGRAPARLARPAMQVDVLPTLLGALGLELDPRIQGVDLLREGEAPAPRPIWSEVNDGNAQLQALRDEGTGWKLVHGAPDARVNFPSPKEWRLYDLARDPGEQSDVSDSAPERRTALQRELEAFRAELEATRQGLGAVETSELGEATRELLDALGYGGKN